MSDSKPNAVAIGNILMADDTDSAPYEVERAMVIQFETVEDFHLAMSQRNIEFTIFESD